MTDSPRSDHETRHDRESDLGHLSLLDSVALVAGHRYLEAELFALTGRWSIEAAAPGVADDAASSNGAIGHDAIDHGGARAMAEFFASQSMIHAWRASEWERRLPRSVDVPAGLGVDGWDAALEAADSSQSPAARLACWSGVLAVQLAGRYRRHRRAGSRVADGGVLRWLDIATRDVLDAVAEGADVLAVVASDGSGPAAVAQCLAHLLGDGS